MKKMTKRILCSVFVLVFMLSSMAATAFAAVYPEADMDISYTGNQFFNVGFEGDVSANNNWRAIYKFNNFTAINDGDVTEADAANTPFDTEVYYGDSGRSLKLTESSTDSYFEIMRIRDYYSNGSNINGLINAGYRRINISAYYKNVSNVKGVQITLRRQSGNNNEYEYNRYIDLTGSDWSKVETTIDLETEKANGGSKNGQLFDFNTGKTDGGSWGNMWYIRFTPISVDDAALCSYNVDDVVIKGVDAKYKYRNLINEKTAAGEDLTEFNSNDKSSTTIAITDRTIDTTIKHSGEGSLKVNGKGWQVCAGFTPTANLEAGETYYLSAWIYSDVQKQIFARYASNGKDNITYWIPGNTSSSSNVTTPNAWKKFEYTFTPNADMLNGLTTYIYFTVGGDCTVYFDDITLRKVPTEATKLVVSNAHVGNIAYGESIIIPFDKEIDPFATLPKRISIGGGIGVVDATPAIVNDGMALALTFADGTLPVGTSTYLSFLSTQNNNNLRDVWGRPITTNNSNDGVSVNFTIVDPVAVSANIYASESATTPLEAWAAGDLVAKADLKNISSKEQTYNCVILFANYQGTELKGVNKVDVTNQVIGAGETFTISNPLTVSEGDNLKVMVWNGMSNMLPIINAVAK